MTTRHGPLLTLAACLLALPLWAQTEGGLSTGEVVAADEPQPGQTYIRETVQDWEIRCLAQTPEQTAAGRPEACQMYQLLKDESATPTAEIVMFKVAAEGIGAGATIITPLETLLTRGLTLTIDNGVAKRYPFTFCNEQGCIAQIGLTTEEVAAMKRGITATLTIVPFVAQNTNVDLTLSLSGFTASFDQLPVREPR